MAVDDLGPCVAKLELHKIVMSHTLLTVGLGAFFLGVCLCGACVCCVWCLSARVSYSVDDGFTTTFDGATLLQHFVRDGRTDDVEDRRVELTRPRTARRSGTRRIEQRRRSRQRADAAASAEETAGLTAAADDDDDPEHASGEP